MLSVYFGPKLLTATDLQKIHWFETFLN